MIKSSFIFSTQEPDSDSQESRKVMSVESTEEVMSKYLNSKHSDVSMMADDVDFTIMATGDKYSGPKEVLEMLDYFYRIAFEADAESRNEIIGEGIAVFEGDFVGRHIGEFAGISATNKSVRVPLCIIYELEENKIKHARVYFEIPALLEQLK